MPASRQRHLESIEQLPFQEDHEHRGNTEDTEFTRCLRVLGCLHFDHVHCRPTRYANCSRIGPSMRHGTSQYDQEVDDDQPRF